MTMDNIGSLDLEIKKLLSLYDETEIAYYKGIVTEFNSQISSEAISVNAINNKEGTNG